jgi:hypothetical protein
MKSFERLSSVIYSYQFNYEGLITICLRKVILDRMFQTGEWTVVSWQDVVKACGIEQGENTSVGSPQCVGGESRVELGHLRAPTTTRRLR